MSFIYSSHELCVVVSFSPTKAVVEISYKMAITNLNSESVNYKFKFKYNKLILEQLTTFKFK